MTPRKPEARPDTKRNRGFTLLEVLIALWLLAGGLLCLAAFPTLVLKSSGETELNAAAFLVFDQVIEPLETLLSEDPASFQRALRNIESTKESPLAAAGITESPFAVEVFSTDRKGTNVLTSRPTEWVPPIFVKIVLIPQEAATAISYPYTHVFVP